MRLPIMASWLPCSSLATCSSLLIVIVVAAAVFASIPQGGGLIGTAGHGRPASGLFYKPFLLSVAVFFMFMCIVVVYRVVVPYTEGLIQVGFEFHMHCAVIIPSLVGLPTLSGVGGGLGDESVIGAHGFYKKPVTPLYHHKKSRAGMTVTKDHLGLLKVPVSIGQPVNFRAPWGADMSGIPMCVPTYDTDLIVSSWDLTGAYVKGREVLLDQAIPNGPKRGKSGTRHTWMRQHWSYFHMDVNLLRLLWRCAYELSVLYHPSLSENDPIKNAYGVPFTIVDKLNQPVIVWLPYVLLNYLTGMLLSDATISTPQHTSNMYTVSHGPSALGMDLTIFGAALLQMCGLGKGYMTLRDNWTGAKPLIYPGNSYLLALTFVVDANSNCSCVFDHMRGSWYPEDSTTKARKIMPQDWFAYFNDIALAFAVMGDGGNDSNSSSTIVRAGITIPYRYRGNLSVHNFDLVYQNQIKNHIQAQFLGNGAVVELKHGGAMEFNSVGTLQISNAIHAYLPNSCMWKLHGSLPVEDYPRYGYMRASLAMDVLNKAWISNDFSQDAWDNAVVPLLHPVSWADTLMVTPGHASVWHSYEYAMSPALYNSLVHKKLF